MKQNLHKRHRDTRAVVHRDVLEIQEDRKPKPKSPKFKFSNSIKICNTYFQIRKGETPDQAEKRILKIFKNNIL